MPWALGRGGEFTGRGGCALLAPLRASPPCPPASIKHGNDPKLYFKGFLNTFEEGAQFAPRLTPPTPSPSHPSSPTFALGHGGGAIEVGGGVAGTGDAVILPKIGLVGAHGAADAAVDARVVVMPGGALDWGGWGVSESKRGPCQPPARPPRWVSPSPGTSSHLPLVSQSWKERAPSWRVVSPPPQGKQSARPTSGW